MGCIAIIDECYCYAKPQENVDMTVWGVFHVHKRKPCTRETCVHILFYFAMEYLTQFYTPNDELDMFNSIESWICVRSLNLLRERREHIR